MKKLFTVLFVFFSTLSFSQAPMEINYQGVARNIQGQAIVNQQIKVRASLIKENDVQVRTTFYTETRTVTTNQLGLFSFKIGAIDASSTTGFININGGWNDGNTQQFLKVELDVANSGTWTDMGTQKIVSVPYALYASEAATAQSLAGSSGAFSAASNASQNLTAGSSVLVSFETTETGSTAFNLGTEEFKAPSAGMYHFDGSVFAGMTAAPVASSVFVQVKVNGLVKRSLRYEVGSALPGIACPFTATLNLNTNDIVTVHFYNSTNVGLYVGGESTYFNGHIIR